ncbi:Protein translocase subunit SecF [bioreactor metagenome]|uniref:Protein translocase subunit SecF n=1 Tax=bioreactor metagenome TaxID=1076179 RepID=A0A645GA20_9ZZZZ
MPGESDAQSSEAADKVVSQLRTDFPGAHFQVAGMDRVGPTVGAEIRTSAIYAGLLALFGILVYVAFRYEFSFAVGAVIAIIHDLLMTTGWYFLAGREMNATTVAALLTIIGFSINDTIVIFDRIREMRELNKDKSYYELINLAVNECMGRTLLTSLTTMLVVLSLLVFGGGAIFDFALIMFFGMFTGTYSTIFIASAFINTWHKRAVRRERVNAEALKKAAQAADATAKA